jgi:hypothetical protein
MKDVPKMKMSDFFFNPKRTLGAGSFGQCYLVKRIDTGEFKVFKVSNIRFCGLQLMCTHQAIRTPSSGDATREYRYLYDWSRNGSTVPN